jgi:hypothetical protein
MNKQNNTLKITVTSDDIKNGYQNSCYRCPIALAISRRLKELNIWYSMVEVFKADVYIYKPSDKEIWLLPAKAQYFITQFDTNGIVEPFEFNLVKDNVI